jgi:hypothetical protein
VPGSLGRPDIIAKKAELDDAIKCLEFCETNNINTTARVIELPYAKAGFFVYRIMIDNESDDRKTWKELNDEQGNTVTAIVGDLIILNSEAKKKR